MTSKIATIPQGTFGGSVGQTSRITQPSARYKYQEKEIELHGIKYRGIVVHSSAHDHRRRKKLIRDLDASEKSINKAIGKMIVEFSCEADALAAVHSLQKSETKLHSLSVKVIPVEIRKPGRPPKNGPAPTRKTWHLEWTLVKNEKEIERLEKIIGCFVLITNMPQLDDGGMNGRGALKTYKGQYGVENGFSFLKDPLIVNDTFLKNPSRIDVLGMVLIISLMVWRLMERSMRAHVEKTEKPMPGLNKQKTKTPTSYMMTTFMRNIMVAVVGNTRLFLKKPKDDKLIYLEALGLTPEVFTTPGFKCVPIIPRKQEGWG